MQLYDRFIIHWRDDRAKEEEEEELNSIGQVLNWPRAEPDWEALPTIRN